MMWNHEWKEFLGNWDSQEGILGRLGLGGIIIKDRSSRRGEISGSLLGEGSQQQSLVFLLKLSTLLLVLTQTRNLSFERLGRRFLKGQHHL